MRIIEPSHAAANKHKKKRSGRLPFLIILIVLLCAGVLYGGYKANLFGIAKKQPGLRGVNSDQIALVDTSEPEKPKTKLRVFSGEEFRKLYDAFVYPNTQEISELPAITGNAEADAHIRKIAIARGYRTRSVPVSPIVKISGVELNKDDLLQEKASTSWVQLQAAAKKAGLPLQISSAYRSVDFQRNLFMTRIAARGVMVDKIAAGTYDAQITEELRTTAIPGYSRHHTGYTVDFVCNGIGLGGFIDTSCYKWLSDNNFANAKTAGWIPSYPANTGLQGPDPEPWEFVWVGTDAVME